MKRLLFALLPLISMVIFAGVERNNEYQYIEHKNLIKNPGFENQGSAWNPTDQAHVTYNISGASLATGDRTIAWDPASGADSLVSDAVAIPNALGGKNCLFSFEYNNGDGNIDAKITDGTATIASVTLAPQASFRKQNLNFICPSSGNLRVEFIATADAAAIAIDDVYVGSASNLFNVSQAELAGKAFQDTGANCQWSVSGGSFSDFPVDNDCQTLTVEHEFIGDWQTTNTFLPEITINNLPPGRYSLIVNLNLSASVDPENVHVRISDGTTFSGQATTRIVGTNTQHVTVVGVFEYTTAGNRTFKMQGGAGSGDVRITVSSSERQLDWTLWKYPSSTELIVAPDSDTLVDWFVSANIGGALIDLGVADVDPYEGIEATTLDMVANSGSLGVQIPCSSTNGSTGLTCAVGDESVGVVYTQPQAGPVLACASFVHAPSVDKNEFLDTTFQIVETPNNAQTITTTGNTRLQSGAGHTASGGGTQEVLVSNPVRVCGTFNFTTAGQKTLRLFYQQLVVGTPSASLIRANRGSNQGFVDIHWEVYPLSQGALTQPQVLNQVLTTESGGVRLEGASLDCDGSSSITDETVGWLSSITNISSGQCDMIFSEPFGRAPFCSATHLTTVDDHILTISTATTSMTIDCIDPHDQNPCASWDGQVVCVGPK